MAEKQINKNKQKQTTLPVAFRSLFAKQGWMSKFLPNVFGTIMGIALTFGVSYLVERHDEEKEMRTMMTLIKQEIVDNENTLKAMIEDFKQIKEMCGLFLSSRYKTLPTDSAANLLASQSIRGFTFKHAAWDIFQNSDVIRNFEDKELILLISELYVGIDEMYKWWQMYTAEEFAAMEFHKKPDEFPNASAYIDARLGVEIFHQFMTDIYTMEKYSFEEGFGLYIDLVDYTLNLIDRHGNYQIKLKDLNEDFETFRKNKK